MSWLKENYEKAALGGAAVIALAVGALILTSDAGEVAPVQNPKRVDTFEVSEKEKLVTYSDVLSSTANTEFVQHEKADLTSFIAYPIYGMKGKAQPGEIKADTLFEGIPLSWWKEHGLDDYQFSGAAENDTDGDGFTHLEEYNAKTDPTDLASHPDLLSKLKLVGSVKKRYRIQCSRVDDERINATFSYKRTTFDICAVGDTFPKKGQPKQFLNRYKVKSKGRAKNPTTNFEEDFYEIEDTKKDGITYKLWSSDGPKKLQDWIAKLKLDTPNGGNIFLAPEGSEFSLPYKEGGKGYKFVINEKRDPKPKELKNINIKKVRSKPAEGSEAEPDVMTLEYRADDEQGENTPD